jgi:excisionase family DNA binding protein
MKVYTPDEAATVLQVSRKTIDRLIKAGKLPASKVGSLKRITEEQLAQYLEDNRVRPTVKPSEPQRQRRGRSQKNLTYCYFERV